MIRLLGDLNRRNDLENYAIIMYKSVFRHMGFHLPFRMFEIAIMDHLQLVPSQLHPNYKAYIMTFQITCQFLKLVSLFLSSSKSSSYSSIKKISYWNRGIYPLNRRISVLWPSLIRWKGSRGDIITFPCGQKRPRKIYASSIMFMIGTKIFSWTNMVSRKTICWDQFPKVWSKAHLNRRRYELTYKLDELSHVSLYNTISLQSYVSTSKICLKLIRREIRCWMH